MDIKVNTETTIVFDLDDTLYNELDYLKSAYKDIATTIDRVNWHKIYAYMFALYREGFDVFDKLEEDYGCSKNELIHVYRKHIPSLQLFDNALLILKEIKNKNGNLGILTDGRSSTQRNKIESLGIGGLIDKIVISEELGTEKPSRNNFLAIERFFETEHYYYIADNFNKDFVTPNKLGWNTIGMVDNGLNIHYNSKILRKPEYLPHRFITSYSELEIIP
tara:strand:- start:576 stop:1235 length:660 start_codon:yes stop_codon:yes gene_type:complete